MIFCNSASQMFMPAKYGASARVKLAKIYVFVHRNLFSCTENYIKINFVVLSVIFLLRESSRPKHKYP